MATKSLFSTLVHTQKLAARTTARLNRELLSDISVIKKLDREGREWSKTNYFGGYTSYSSIADVHLRFAPFMELKTLIDREAKKYIRALDVDLQRRKVQMTTCWVNVMPKYSHHSLHLHPLGFISGTYYVQVPPGSGRLKLEDPRLGLFMGAPQRKPKNPYFYEINPQPGQVVLWESWLRHEVTANTSSIPRISISFNYEWI